MQYDITYKNPCHHLQSAVHTLNSGLYLTQLTEYSILNAHQSRRHMRLWLWSFFIVANILISFLSADSKPRFVVYNIISDFTAVSARDSILMKNSMHMNCNMDYYSILSCIFDRKNSLYALKNTTHSIIIKGERDWTQTMRKSNGILHLTRHCRLSLEIGRSSCRERV